MSRNETPKYLRWKIEENSTLDDIYTILQDERFDAAYIVFIENKIIKRFPIPQFKDRDSFHEWYFSHGAYIKEDGVDSENFALVKASYIDLYFKKKIYPIK